jgi:predicted nucleotidyltransferase
MRPTGSTIVISLPSSACEFCFRLLPTTRAASMHLKPDFKEFVESLNANGVEYVVVGAYAVAFHGIPRYTRDIDFFVQPSHANGERVVNALKAFGFGSLGLSADDFAKPDQIVQLGVEPSRIDIITSIEAVPFDEAHAHRNQVEIDGVKLWFLGRDQLIRNKRAVGRPQDLADAARLEDLDR